MTSASDEKWRPFTCFFSRVGLRTYQHPCMCICWLKKTEFELYCTDCKTYKSQIFAFRSVHLHTPLSDNIHKHLTVRNLHNHSLHLKLYFSLYSIFINDLFQFSLYIKLIHTQFYTKCVQLEYKLQNKKGKPCAVCRPR